VIVQKSVQQAFTDRLVAAAEKLRVGDGLNPQIDMGPLVNRGRVKAVHEYAEIGKMEGARLVLGGSPLTGDDYSEGAYYEPTIFTDVGPSMRIATEEIFGPFVSIVPVTTYEEAIKVANSTEYGLSTAIFTESTRLTFRAMRDIESGLVYFNAPTTGAEIHMPFGGMKASGNGHRELGAGAVEEFSETKSIFISYPVRK
jgi:aldehyde dehydrogenase (NAD+)